jgi:hypothetical protein
MMKIGDRIASIAQPLARSIAAIWGSDLVNCLGCAQRRDLLNENRYLDAFRTFFDSKQPTEENKMQFQVQIVVEAEGVAQAITPEIISQGTIISVTPRPQQPQAGVRPGMQVAPHTPQQ